MTSQRIDTIAQQLHLPSTDVLAAAQSARIGVTSATSTVTDHEADVIRAVIGRQARKLSAAPPRPAPARFPAAAPGRGRPTGRPRRSTDLSPMERAILPYELRGRPTISAREAAQLHHNAIRWAAAGLDDTTVRPWYEADIVPEQAGYLAQRGLSATVLELTLPVGVGGRRRVSVAEALAEDMWPVERIYEMLVAAGIHTPTPEPQVIVLPEPPTRPAKTSHVPPVVFSHPGTAGTEPVPFRPPRRQNRDRGPRRGR